MKVLPLIFILLSLSAQSHPDNTLIAIDNYVLWSWVDPAGGDAHHGSVMIWDGVNVSTLITSEFGASEYFLSVRNDSVIFVESRYTGGKNHFRVLKGLPGEQPDELWPWQEDPWGIGNGGFFFSDQGNIIFCSYPGIFELSRGGSPVTFMDSEKPVKMIRKMKDESLLLLSENYCSRMSAEGKLISEWNNYIDPRVSDAPLARNSVFDVTLHGQDLVVAYWGKRVVLKIEPNMKAKVIHSLTTPYTPHAVACEKDRIFILSSTINPPEPIKPALVMIEGTRTKLVWDGN